jgi:acyl transferase domain-containing protein
VREDLLRAAGDLFECGANPRWAAVIGDAAGPRADLPFYPFQREIYWIDAPQNREEKPSRVFAGAGIRRSQPAEEGRVRFEARVSRRAVAAWFGAAGKGSRELPFSALMAIAVDAERQQRPEDAVALGGLRIDAPIALSLESRVVHTVVDDPGERRAIYTASETGEWTCHAAWRRGSVSMADCAVPRDVPDAARLGREEFYARARAAGLNVSSRFEVIDSVEIGREVLRGRLHLPDGAAEPIRTLMLAEGCAQLVQAASAAAGTLGSVTIGGVDALVIAPLAVQSLAVDVVWHTHAEELELTLTGRDEEGRPVVVLRGVRAHHARSSSESARVRLRDRLAAASDAEKPVFLSDYVRAAAAHVLGLRGDRGLDLDEPLSRQGLDSLMALQLSTAIAVELDVRLPVTQIVDRSVRSLLDDIGRALERPDGRDVPAVPSAFVHGEL